MTARVLETVLTARNLLSPELLKAARDVTAFQATVDAANGRAGQSATGAARVQQSAAATSVSASAKASSAAADGAAVQSSASARVTAANARAAESASASATVQAKAHTQAAQSATLSARAQESANRALSASNGLLGTSLTPLTAGLGAIGLGLGYATYRGMEFDSAMSQVQAATMATAADMSRLRDAAIEQGAKTKYSSEEAAQGITEMAKAGVSTADILGGGLAGALNLAAAGQIDVGSAAEIAATQLTVFGLRGNEVNHVADLLAAGAGKAQGSVQDMALALQYAGLPAKGLGLSIEDTTGALGLFASNGLIGEKAGTSFRGMLVSMTNPVGKTAELMDSLNLSFFDAQGNFVGMSGVAQQLHDRLGPLTEQTRNAALAQIFGNEALGAAQILYNSGAAGVQQWTRNVDDAGYAARQAAINQDNLKGDLEKLAGAFDSAMTTIGGGTQGPLRDLTQMLTWLVETGGDVIGFWNSLPGPVQASVVALAGVAVLGGPVSSALETIALKALYAAESTSAASLSMGGLKAAGSGLLSVLGGPVGLAIAGSTVAIGFMVKGLVDMGEATVDTAGYQEQLAGALTQSKGAIDQNVRALAAQQAAEVEITSKASLLDYAQRAGVDLGLLTDALLGNKDAAAQVAGQFDVYTQKMAAAAEARGVDADSIAASNEANNRAKDAIGQLVPVLGDAQTKNAQLAEATGQAGAATQAAIDPAQALQSSLENVATAASDSKKQIDLYKTSLDVLNGAHLTAIQAESDFYAAIDAANGALDNLTGTALNGSGALDLHSEAGRKTQDVLLGVKDSADQYIATLIEQGATSDVANAKDAELRQSFYETALQMTGSKEAAQRLTDQIYGIPDQRTTTISADTKQATDAAAAVQAAIDNLKGRTLTISLATMQTGAGTFQQSFQTADGGRALSAKYQAQGGILGDRMTAGVAEVVPPNTWRVIGDRMADDEAYIPINSSVRSRAILEQTAARMGYGLTDEARYLANGGLLNVQLGLDDSAALAGMASYAMAAANTAATPSAGSGGGMSGTWTSIWGIVKAAFPQARQNSTYRPGDPGYHGKNKAVDFGFGSGPGGNGSAGLASIAAFLYSGYGRTLAELIYDGVGDSTPDVKNGRDHVYNASTRAEHHNHVHAAVYHQGTDYVPQTGWAYLEKGEAVIPASQNPAGQPGYSSPFSGDGMRIEGILDLGGGLTGAIRGEVVSFMTGQTDRGRYNPR